MISNAFPDFDLSTLPPIPSDWIVFRGSYQDCLLFKMKRI